MGLLEVSPESRIVRCNAAFAQMLGQDPANLVNVEIDHITHPEDRGKGREAVREVLEGKAQYLRQKKRYVQRDGTTIWATLTSVPIYDYETGAVELWISVVVPTDSAGNYGSAIAMQQKIDELEKVLAMIMATSGARARNSKSLLPASVPVQAISEKLGNPDLKWWVIGVVFVVFFLMVIFNPNAFKMSFYGIEASSPGHGEGVVDE